MRSSSSLHFQSMYIHILVYIATLFSDSIAKPTVSRGFDARVCCEADLDEPLPDLPAEDARVVPLVLLDLVLHLGGGDTRLAAPDDPGPDAPRLLVPEPITVQAAIWVRQ